MTFDWVKLALIVIGIVLLLAVGRFVFALAGLAIPILVAGVIFLFVADKLTGGTAIDQLITKITNWIRRQQGG